MMRTLFVKEIRDAFASRRFWVILALCLVLIPLGIAVSLKDYQTRLQNYREALRIYREGTKQVQDILYGGGAKAFAPPASLSFMSLGLELVLPNVAETPAGQVDPPVVMRVNSNQGYDNLYEFFSGPLDLVFVVTVVMSLLAVILTFGAVSGEKESGTLGLVLSNSVSRAKVILAKVTANGLVLIVPFLLTMFASLMIIQLRAGSVLSDGGSWTSVGLGVLISILLVGVFSNLGLLISSLTKQSVPALIVLLLAWAFLYGVYPRLSVVAAESIYPLKSEAHVTLEKAQVRRDIEIGRDTEIDRAAKTMPQDLKSEAFKAGRREQQEIRDRYRAKLEESWRKIDRDIEGRRTFQYALINDIARLSPVSSFMSAMAEVSRTSWLEFRQFKSLVGQYEDVLNREIFDKEHFTKFSRGQLASNSADPRAPAPVFNYLPMREDHLVRNVLPDVALLLLFNFILFAGAFVVFLRYDPR
jgi:ABC-type transport system involved in multi-copper enzyme maturation permease subunit